MADIVLLSTADWDHPLWTNKQHVACSLAAEGQRVLYVESLGLRPPQVESQDFSGSRRLLRGCSAFSRQASRALGVVAVGVPGGTRGVALRLNRVMFVSACLWLVGSAFPLATGLWTYNPLTFISICDVAGALHFRCYHAVDAVQEHPCPCPSMPAILITGQPACVAPSIRCSPRLLIFRRRCD